MAENRSRDIEPLDMDKSEEWKIIEDTLARIMELKAARDQTIDPKERRRLRKEILELQYLQIWQVTKFQNEWEREKK